MSDPQTAFPTTEGHRHFSVACFNRTWTYIGKPKRTPEEDEEMVLCALASLWHWTQRPDCTDRHRSVGHWQVSRAMALARRGEEAMRHGMASLKYSADATAFYRGYAHEALARAAMILGHSQAFDAHLADAWQCAGEVSEKGERDMLEADLRSIEAGTR